MEKFLGQSFFVLSTLTNFKEQIISAHVVLTINVEVIRYFLGPEGSIENLFKKGCFPREKNGVSYLALLSMANLRRHFIRLHKIFWQSLCK